MRHGNINISRFLLDNGAKADARDNSDETLLHWVALRGNEKVCRIGPYCHSYPLPLPTCCSREERSNGLFPLSGGRADGGAAAGQARKNRFTGSMEVHGAASSGEEWSCLNGKTYHQSVVSLQQSSLVQSLAKASHHNLRRVGEHC